jgi:hypothetical protein
MTRRKNILLRYLSHATGSEGFEGLLAQDEERRRDAYWRHASGGAAKYCVKKTGYMAHD